MNFSDDQAERYSRHLILNDVGPEGQEKLLNGKVLIVGLGGLGSPAAFYLAAAGVGHVGLIDGDTVDLTNLQRQIIHATGNLGEPKVVSARKKMNNLNPDVQVEIFQERLTASNIRTIIKDYDFIIDGTDNFSSKFLINDGCVLGKKAFSHGGLLRFSGQTMTYTPGNACYRCVFVEPPPKDAVPSCAEAGILGSVAGILGTIQATEALKYLIGLPGILENRMLVLDSLNWDVRTIAVSRDSNCPVCGGSPKITTIADGPSTTCETNK